MDTGILQHLGPWGLAIVILIAGVKWVAIRLAEAERRAESRADAALARCDADRKSLTDKVDRLEDQIAHILDETVRRSTDALQQHVEWFRRFVEMSDSDFHKAQQNNNGKRP